MGRNSSDKFMWDAAGDLMKMVRKDKRDIIENCQEIRLFLVERNESLRLPDFLRHYRGLGVDSFFIIDNGSSDDTMDYLLAQEDVHVFFTDQGFQEKEYWIRELLDQYGAGCWCLVVDADELFLHPYYEDVTLRKVCRYLELRQCDTMENLLIDMYPKGDIHRNIYFAGESLIDNSPYYDADGYQRVLDERRNLLSKNMVKEYTYFGGTRSRYFHVRKLCCSKYPLFRYNRKMFIDAGMHGIEGARKSDLQGVVLHFKFLYDFPLRAEEEVKRGVHYDHAREYKKYAEKMKEQKECILYQNNSIKFEGSRQLIEYGFMKVTSGYEQYIRQNIL